MKEGENDTGMREKRKERVKVNRMHIYIYMFKYLYTNICMMQLHVYKIVEGKST